MDAARFILICLAGWMNRNQQDVIEYLKEEVRVLKEHLGGRQCSVYEATRVSSGMFRVTGGICSIDVILGDLRVTQESSETLMTQWPAYNDSSCCLPKLHGGLTTFQSRFSGTR